MRVLGIDPSSRATGYGLIESGDQDPVVLAYGAVKPPARAALPAKLLAIKSGISGLIALHRPDEIAVENPFLAKNTKTALLLGQVHELVLGDLVLVDVDIAAPFEAEGDAALGADLSAVLAEDVADLGNRAVLVVGQAGDVNGHAAGAVAFINHFFVLGAFQLAGALLDGPLDVVGGHVGVFGGLDGAAQARVLVGVAAAGAGGHGDFADDFGEDLAALGVGRAFFMLNRRPFGMSGHVSSFGV